MQQFARFIDEMMSISRKLLVKVHLRNIKQAVVVISAMFTLSCSTPLLPLPEPEPLPFNAVCNHEFSASQTELQPSFIERETNSIIVGDTTETLLSSLDTSTDFQGRGNSRWVVKWSFDARRSGIACAVSNVVTSVEVDYNFPLWPEQLSVTDRTLADQWNQYSDAMRAHHCRHGKAGIDASLELKARLQQLQGSGSCDALIEQGDALAKSIINGYKQLETSFTPPQISDFLRVRNR